MLDISPLATDCNPATQGPEIGDPAELPVGLDPRRLPIIATHFFGWRPVGDVVAQMVQDLTFRHKVKRLVAKGDRVVGEMLAELAADRNLGTVIDQLLDRYIELDDAALEAIGGRTLPPLPLHEVGR